MLTANALKSKGFRADHLFDVKESGAVIATLNETRFTFEHGGVSYAVQHKGAVSPEYTLRCGDTELATATRAPFVNRYTMILDGREWVLKAEGFLEQKFVLYLGENRVGGVVAGGYFSQFKGITAEFPEEIPAPIQLFLLLILIWKWSDTGS